MRTLTKRAVLYVGYLCNLRCQFCFVKAPGLGLPKIQTKYGIKKIDQVREGDEVLTVDEKTSSLVWTKVKKVILGLTDSFCKIRTKSGRVFNVTNEHPFYVSHKGWVEARDLKINDDLLFVRGRELTGFLRKTKYIPQGIMPYDVRMLHSQRMKEHNPMFNPVFVEKSRNKKDYNLIGQKISTTCKEKFKGCPKWKRPTKGGFSLIERENRRQRMLTKNPMFNPESVIKSWINKQKGKSKPEIIFEKICNKNNFPIRYIGNGTFWLKNQNIAINPDFKVNHEKKVIEIFDSKYKHRGENGYAKKRKNLINSFGYDCLIIDMNKRNFSEDAISGQVRQFVSNGDKIVSVEHISKGNKYKGKRGSYQFDKSLETINFSCEPYNTFLADRILVHNCYYTYMPNFKKAWQPIDKLKGYINIFKEYGCEAVDITGGEPTIYPDIQELVTYCREVGIRPTLITNMQVLKDDGIVKQFKISGIEDFLCSIHAMGDDYDNLVQHNGAWNNIVNALRNIVENEIPFRVNCVLTNVSMKILSDIAEFSHVHKAKVINFISFNPFYEWGEKKDQAFQAKHSEIWPYLEKALVFCDSVGMKANVRYFPFCQMVGQESKCINFPQLSYDLHEWNFKAWYSEKTDAPCHKFPDSFYDNFKSYEDACFNVALIQRSRLYAKSSYCDVCGLTSICDGFTTQYAQRYGLVEAKPYLLNGVRITNPAHFMKGV